MFLRGLTGLLRPGERDAAADPDRAELDAEERDEQPRPETGREAPQEVPALPRRGGGPLHDPVQHAAQAVEPTEVPRELARPLPQPVGGPGEEIRRRLRPPGEAVHASSPAYSVRTSAPSVPVARARLASSAAIRSAVSRCTYGAVGDVLEPRIIARGVGRLLGESRPETSWIVNGRTRMPTGYAPEDIHPDLDGSPLVTGPEELRRMVERHRRERGGKGGP